MSNRVQEIEYQITVMSHIRQAYAIIFFVAPVPVIFYLGDYDGGFGLNATLIITTMPAILVILFQLLIHIQYSIVNRNTTVKVSKNRGSIYIKKNYFEVYFEQNDVSAYEVFLPKSINRKSIGLLPWDDYFYTKITLNCGDVFYVTSLLLPDSEIFIKSVKTIITEKNYSFINFSEANG